MAEGKKYNWANWDIKEQPKIELEDIPEDICTDTIVRLYYDCMREYCDNLIADQFDKGTTMIITLGDALKEFMQKLEKERHIGAPTTLKQIGENK